MGSTLAEWGTTFRVWAPHADTVHVVGSFNGWDTARHPLASEHNGFWSADIPEARAGDRYKFVLSGPHLDGPTWRNDPWAVLLTNSAGDSLITEADVAAPVENYRTPPWNELVIYELHVGTFNVDPNYRGGRGNFDTVIAKLDYLRDLGVTAIELMPTDEFPGDISWGYNPSYAFAVEESYGGPRGLARLIEAAHRRGIAVIIDVVFNHLGPADLDMWRYDGWHGDPDGGPNAAPNAGMGGGVWFYNDWRAQTPWGNTRPDYGRGEVRSYLHDAALRWLEQRGCDGLRWDATGWIRNVWGNTGGPDSDLPDGWSLMQWINRDKRDRQPWKISIAEDMSGAAAITAPPEQGGAGFDAQWAATFVHGIRDLAAHPDDAGRSMFQLAFLLGLRPGEGAFSRVLYTESHDEVAAESGQLRLPQQISPGGDGADRWARKRSTL
ncbi:MAG: 1,4-alpha-glucan branching protein, partial [Gluconacetobacter diazotrophicus]|nr:1,4-alpha-glucan branching protein [Gluconacetobacter diazotrophicus]